MEASAVREKCYTVARAYLNYPFIVKKLSDGIYAFYGNHHIPLPSQFFGTYNDDLFRSAYLTVNYNNGSLKLVVTTDAKQAFEALGGEDA